MKIGCGTVVFRKFSLEEALGAIREAGFEYFETQAVGPWCPHVDVERDDPENLVKLKNKYGFREITGLWTLNGNLISNPDSVRAGILSVQWAAAAGIRIVHTGDGHKPKDMTDEDAFAILAERLAAIAEEAKKLSVKLAVEPHGAFSLTADGLKRILSVCGSDVLGVNYDPCNVFRASYVESGGVWKDGGRGESESDVLKAVLPRVIHFHAKDIDKFKNCVALGEGLVDLDTCLDILKAGGYRGAVSLETEGGDDLDAAKALTKKSRDYLRSRLETERS